MPKVVHFEIHADDPDKLGEFYSKIFDWKIKKWEGPINYWLIETGTKNEPGIGGAIKERVTPISSESIIAYVCSIDVPDIDQSLEKVKEHGGQIIQEKMEIPGIGFHAYCKDPEGNVFGIMESNQ